MPTAQHLTVAFAGTPGRRTSGLVFTSIAGVVMAALAGLFLFRGFLPDLDAADDGFRTQLFYMGSLLSDGGFAAALADNALIGVHAARFMAAAPFLAAEAAAGPIGSLSLLLLLLLPLVYRSLVLRNRWWAMLPLALPFAVSGRSVLVAAGIGYVILFLLRPKARCWALWLGALLANLSSASVLTSMLLLLFVERADRRSNWARLHGAGVLALLLLSFLASLSEKLGGFSAGESGYEAHAFDSDNVALAVLGRATLLVSLAEGQYLRAIVYLAIAVFLVFKLASLMRDPHARLSRRVLLCCFSGLLMEGLGIFALFFPLFWLVISTRRARRPRMLPPPASPGGAAAGGRVG